LKQFEEKIEEIYQNTSKRLLELIFTKYELMSHIESFRKYLLLGQGDFVQRLMDLIEFDFFFIFFVFQKFPFQCIF